jgi:2-aminobenzoylacetyl-CoA thioesterase
MGRIYERDIRKVLGHKKPGILFLTHVHYDHCGATSYFKKVFPGLKVVASGRAAEIMARPNAVSLMISLSEIALGIIASMDGIESDLLLREPFEPFSVDTLADEGQVMPIGEDLSVHVFSTPGHTRDMLTYYLPERKMLIATESAGVQGQTGHIVSEFIVDFDAYMRSLKLFLSLDIDVLCQGHHFVFVGDDVRTFLVRSLETAEQFREHVENVLKEEGGDIERVVGRIKTWEYDPNPGPKQPEKAYLLNLRTRVAHLAHRQKMSAL